MKAKGEGRVKKVELEIRRTEKSSLILEFTKKNKFQKNSKRVTRLQEVRAEKIKTGDSKFLFSKEWFHGVIVQKENVEWELDREREEEP